MIHEFGHYFGLSEEEIEDIEERYWRGDPTLDDGRATIDPVATSGTAGPRVQPRKRFGQHFLEPAWAPPSSTRSDPAPDDVFLEIGPGTRSADGRSRPARGRTSPPSRIDRDLAARLRVAPPAQPHHRGGDALDIDLARLIRERTAGPVRVVGNLPYNVASPIVFALAAGRGTGLSRRDVDAAARGRRSGLAGPGSGDYGPLAIAVQLAARAPRGF